MPLPLQLQTFTIGSQTVALYVPDAKAVQTTYAEHKAINAATHFPYWAQVWPAAQALALFLLQHPFYLKGKKVLELAAGLGLPSLVAAPLAQQVTCTDYMAEAVHAAQQSAQHNGLHNMQCHLLDWNKIPGNTAADLLLLSDINYEPAQFEMLYKVLHHFLEKGTTILLSTPQRLLAKPFVERLLPLSTKQETLTVEHHRQSVLVTILVLTPTPKGVV